jgi:hypothetical protein
MTVPLVHSDIFVSNQLYYIVHADEIPKTRRHFAIAQQQIFGIKANNRNSTNIIL